MSYIERRNIAWESGCEHRVETSIHPYVPRCRERLAARLSVVFAGALAFGYAQAQTVEYLHTDALGTPVAVTNSQGQVIERTSYRPYGLSPDDLGRDRPAYAGHVKDSATGLSYMQQRYYDLDLGRFLSVDPVTAQSGTGANFNRYWYANNNPYRFNDPDGRKCTSRADGDSCTFDEFRNGKGNVITREQALAGGSKLAKFLGVDRGSRIIRAERGMTEKYTAAKGLAARGGGASRLKGIVPLVFRLSPSVGPTS